MSTVKAWLETKKGNEIMSTNLASENIDTTAPTSAHIQYEPSEEEQLAQSPQGIISDLVIQYDVNHEFNAGNIQVTCLPIYFLLPPANPVTDLRNHQ